MGTDAMIPSLERGCQLRWYIPYGEWRWVCPFSQGWRYPGGFGDPDITLVTDARNPPCSGWLVIAWD